MNGLRHKGFEPIRDYYIFQLEDIIPPSMTILVTARLPIPPMPNANLQNYFHIIAMFGNKKNRLD